MTRPFLLGVELPGDATGNLEAVPKQQLDAGLTDAGLYVQSRLQNLITNGSGLLADNTNFSSFTFDPADTHGGGGSFLNTGGPITVYADEYLPVDPEKYYRLIAWGKTGDVGGGNYDTSSRQYLGVECIDADLLSIHPRYFFKFAGSTDTTLAAELAPDATTVTVTDATGWHNSTTAFARNFAWWPYVNAKGYTYPDYTYSRNASSNYHTDWSSNGSWLSGGITGNVITLRKPWEGPTLPAGTPIRNVTSGSTFKYIAASNQQVPNAWTRYEGAVGTLDVTSINNAFLFSPGTAYVRLVFLVNQSGASTTTVRWSDLVFTEMSTRNLEAASTTVPGVVTYGTASATAAQGNDTRITGALQRSVATTKGDMFAASASATVARLPVGGNGQALVADSAQTLGVRWGVPLDAVSSKTAGYTLLDADSVVLFDTTAGTMTATLPTAVGRTGKRFTVKVTAGANLLTLASNGGTIDGASTDSIAAVNGFITVVSDGSNWQIVGRA